MSLPTHHPVRNRRFTATSSSPGHRAMRGAAALALALLGGSLHPTAVAAQSDTLEAALAALAHVHQSLPESPAMLDPRLLCSATLAGWSCPAGFVDRVAKLGMRLGSREFSYLCVPAQSGCRLVGTDVLVELSDLRLFGRTATITADVWWHRQDPGHPVGRRRSHLHLQRNDDWTWRVTAEEMRVPDEPPQSVPG